MITLKYNHNGVHITESLAAIETVKDFSTIWFNSFHKSKCRRNRPIIRHVPCAYRMGNRLIMHPSLVKELKKQTQ